MRGSFVEGRAAFERAIAGSGGEPGLHARALYHGASFAFRRGELATARGEWERALELFRRLGEEDEVARCIAELGGVAIAEGDLETAETLYREAAVAFAAQEKPLREAAALGNLASIAAERGDWKTADVEGARVARLQRENHDQEGLTVTLHNHARVKLALGQVDDARTLARESLTLAERLGYLEVIAYGLGTSAEIALVEGDPERAARLLGHSDAVFAEIGVVRFGEDATAYERTLGGLRERLGVDRLARLREEGAALALEQGVGLAVQRIATRP